MKINIKPLSVNKAWMGRRFKTPEYHAYELELSYLLPNITIPEGDLAVNLIFGIPKAMDWDNSIKSFVDVLQKRYKFNDNRIMKATVEKRIVAKGEEFIDFEISSIE